IQVQHRQAGLWIDAQPPGEEVTDQILEESAGRVLVALLGEVNETEKARGYCVNDARDAVGVHVRHPLCGDGLAKRLPFVRLAHEQALIYRTGQLPAGRECKIRLARDKRPQRLRLSLREIRDRSLVNVPKQDLVSLALYVGEKVLLQFLVRFQRISHRGADACRNRAFLQSPTAFPEALQPTKGERRAGVRDTRHCACQAPWASPILPLCNLTKSCARSSS